MRQHAARSRMSMALTAHRANEQEQNWIGELL